MSKILSVSSATVLIDALTVLLTFSDVNFFYKSASLSEWYEKYRIAAAALDVLILIIGFYVIDYQAKRLKIRKFSRLYYVLMISLQMLHDVLFYFFFTVLPNGLDIFDFFKKYAREDGIYAILGDSLMMIGTAMLYQLIEYLGLSRRNSIMLLLTSIYVLLYILYLK